MYISQKKFKFRFSLLLLMALFLTACGYRPSAHYAQKVIGQRVYTKVDVSLANPENAVLTKDGLNRALQTRLKTIVTRKEDADSMIGVQYENIQFIPLQYDVNGYVVHYQVNMRLKFTFEKEGVHEEYRTVGRYEFPILPTAIIAYDVQLRAIEQSSQKALDQFIAYLGAKGYFVDASK